MHPVSAAMRLLLNPPSRACRMKRANHALGRAKRSVAMAKKLRKDPSAHAVWLYLADVQTDVARVLARG